QSFGDRLRQRAKDKITQRAEMRADQAMDRALDATEGAIVCAVTDSKCVEEAEKSGKQVVLTNEEGEVVGHSAAEAAAPGSKAWANYDFVPGERVIFAEDFTADRVGDFPRRLEFRSEEHTSELQSRENLVCRLLHEKKKCHNQ